MSLIKAYTHKDLEKSIPELREFTSVKITSDMLTEMLNKVAVWAVENSFELVSVGQVNGRIFYVFKEIIKNQ